MRKDQLARERRQQRAFERFGTLTPRCEVCGETDWRCLDMHHLVGRRHDSMTVVLCANHHRMATDAQKDHPTSVSDGDAFLECVGRFLLGLADLLRLMIERLVEFGNALIQRARADAPLDREARS